MSCPRSSRCPGGVHLGLDGHSVSTALVHGGIHVAQVRAVGSGILPPGYILATVIGEGSSGWSLVVGPHLTFNPPPPPSPNHMGPDTPPPPAPLGTPPLGNVPIWIEQPFHCHPK